MEIALLLCVYVTLVFFIDWLAKLPGRPIPRKKTMFINCYLWHPITGWFLKICLWNESKHGSSINQGITVGSLACSAHLQKVILVGMWVEVNI